MMSDCDALREELVQDIEYLMYSSVNRGISRYFIAGLETARDIVSGRISLHPSVYEDSNQPELFNFDEDGSGNG